MVNEGKNGGWQYGVAILLVVVADICFFVYPIAGFAIVAVGGYCLYDKIKDCAFAFLFCIALPMCFSKFFYIGLVLLLLLSIYAIKVSVRNLRHTSQCALCHSPLTIFNTGMGGRLRDDRQICTRCLSSFPIDFAANIEKKTIDEVRKEYDRIQILKKQSCCALCHSSRLTENPDSGGVILADDYWICDTCVSKYGFNSDISSKTLSEVKQECGKIRINIEMTKQL